MLVVSNSRPTKHNIQILLALVLADIYRAGTLLPKIIVTLIIQKHIRTAVYVSYVFLSIPHSATVDRNQLVLISFN